MTFYEYISGQIIFCETETGNQLYLIKSGEVLITKINSDGASTLDILGKGEIFGEMAVLNEKNTKTSHHTTNKRSATAIARTDATLVAVSREKIKKIFELKNFHVFAEKLLKTLLRRIWHTKVVLISRSLNDPLDKITAILYSEIFKNTNTVELKKNTQKEKPFEFDFGILGLIERMGPEITITKEPVLPERFSLDDFLKRSLLKTGYGASIMKSKKMFTFSDHHIVCESPKEIIHAWEKVKKNGF